jgi:SAM-dependent methyltransferase
MPFWSEILAHPLTRGMSLDDPRTTELRTRIIREKGFLRQIYEEWYRLLVGQIPEGGGAVLEIGSGGGFLKEYRKDALASEVFFTPHVDVVLNAMEMPFKAASLRAILMVDVLHHIPEPALFFSEATRCVATGGRCLLIEPWNTPWAKWVYQHLHHEPFNPEGGWSIPSAGPLSGANGALPWILVERDYGLFCRQFPEWHISLVTPIMPLVYLLSGGVSLRSLMPAWSYQWVRRMEMSIESVERTCGMFAFIILERS